MRCFDGSGAASDEQFTVFFLKSQPGTRSTLYAYAALPANPSYAPSSTYAFNPAGGAITATRISTGVYGMTFAGAGSVGVGNGHVQVTAYGSGSSHCKVASWGSESVNVSCFDAAGNPADSAYTVLYLRPAPRTTRWASPGRVSRRSRATRPVRAMPSTRPTARSRRPARGRVSMP